MIPTLEEFAQQLMAVSGATEIEADTPFVQISDVDSMDLMEWLYTFQNDNAGTTVDAAIFENSDGSATLRIVHDRLSAAVLASVG